MKAITPADIEQAVSQFAARVGQKHIDVPLRGPPLVTSDAVDLGSSGGFSKSDSPGITPPSGGTGWVYYVVINGTLYTQEFVVTGPPVAV